jgi:hypothetical protein
MHRKHYSNMFRLLKHRAIFGLCWQSLISTVICKRIVRWRTLKQIKWDFIFFIFICIFILFLFNFNLLFFVIFMCVYFASGKYDRQAEVKYLLHVLLLKNMKFALKSLLVGFVCIKGQRLINCTLMNVS